MKAVLRPGLYLGFLLLIAGYFIFPAKKEDFNYKQGYAWESFVPSLAFRLQSVDGVISYADSAIGRQNRNTLDYVRFLSKTVSDCFYHGYSYYSYQHNWIAFIAGKLFWKNLSAIVVPDDILKHPEGACSQVSLVLAACLKKVGVTYRKVGLNGHFILEAYLNGNWYLFDPNLEPHFPNGRKSLAALIKDGELYAGYAGRKTPEEIKQVFSRIEYGKPNAPLAAHAVLFQKVTYYLSIAIALFLALYVIIDVSLWMVKAYKRNLHQITLANPSLAEEKVA